MTRLDGCAYTVGMTKPAKQTTALLAELDIDAPATFTKLGTAVVRVDGQKLIVDEHGVQSAESYVGQLRQHLIGLRHEFEFASGARRGPWGAAIKSTEREIAQVRAGAARFEN